MAQGRKASGVGATTLIAVALLAGIAGVFLGALVASAVLDEEFRRDFFTSAGFGGLAALFAAVVAYAAARHTARSAREEARADRDQNERSDRKAQWWSRAEWALTQVASGDDNAAIIGHGVLEALATSEWAGEHEADVIAAATEVALDAVEVPSDGEQRDIARQSRVRDHPSTFDAAPGRMEEGGHHE